MNFLFRFSLIIVLCSGWVNAYPQKRVSDSLLSLIRTDKEDTAKVKHLNAAGWSFMYSNTDTATILAQQALSLAEKLCGSAAPEIKKSALKGKADALNNLGVFAHIMTDYQKAQDYFEAAFKIGEETKHVPLQINCLGNLGNVHMARADYPGALDYYFKALHLSEASNNKAQIASWQSNIGHVYYDQTDHKKALEYYNKALKAAEEIGNRNQAAGVTANIGNVYCDIAERMQAGSEEQNTNFSLALKHYNTALKINEELGNRRGMASRMGNIGIVYAAQSQYQLALDYYFRALKINEEFSDQNSIAIRLGNIAAVLIKQKKYEEAEKNLLRALAIDTTIGFMLHAKDTYESLSELYSLTGSYKLSLFHYKKARELRDTIFSEENKQELVRQEMNFEFEKKEAVAEAEHKKELESQKAIAEEKSRKQKIILLFVVSGLLLVVAFAVFIFRSLRSARRQKALIELQKEEVMRQKEIVEEKQREILDSIRYAKRIQTALLANEKYVTRVLNDLK